MEIVSRTGRDTGQGRTVKEERNCRAGQELPGKGMAHVPGGKGAGGAPSVMTNGRSASRCAWESGWGPHLDYLVLSSLISSYLVLSII